MNFYNEIEQWTDSTPAKGSQMNVPLQKLLSNTLYLKEQNVGSGNSLAKASDDDLFPGSLLNKLEFGSGLRAEVVPRQNAENPLDLALRIHREDELSIMTPAVAFQKILADVEVNASNVDVGQWLDCRFAPVNFPSGFIYSISFMLVPGTFANAVNVAIYGNNQDSLSGSELWFSLRNKTLSGNEIVLDAPTEIVRFKYNWAVFGARGGARFVGKLPNPVVPANGDAAGVGVINNWIQDGTQAWPETLGNTTHNTGSFPYIQFNITR